MTTKWKREGKRQVIRSTGKVSEVLAEVEQMSGAVHEGRWWWEVVPASEACGSYKTEAAAKRAAERALVKYGRKLVKAGGGE